MEQMPHQTIMQETEAAREIATLIEFIVNTAENNSAHNITIVQLYVRAKNKVKEITYRPSRNIYLHILQKRTVEGLNQKFLPIPYHTDWSLYWYNEPPT